LKLYIKIVEYSERLFLVILYQFIIVHRQRGVVVNPGDGPKISEEYLQQLHNDLKPIIAEAFCRGMPVGQFKKICDDIFSNLKLKKDKG